MKWIKTQEFYDEFINVDLISSPDCEVDYESFTQAILADMHMVDIPRKEMLTENDFILFAHKAFPEDSEAFAWSRKIIGLKYYALDKNEFVACFKRSSDESQMIFRPRAEIEYVPEYVQYVAMAIPFFYVNGKPVFLFLLEKSSDMKGMATMIGGHIQYDGNMTDRGSFETLTIQTAKKEAVEELGLSDKVFKYVPDADCIKLNRTGNPTGKIKFDTRNNVAKSSISYYHIGFGYTFELANYESSLMEIEMERGKELLLFSPEPNVDTKTIKDYRNREIPVYNFETFNKANLNPEPWLMSLIDLII